MPQSCRYMRTRLQIEYVRLLDWSEVAGLIEYQEGQDLPDSLKADRLVLVAILTEIRALMDDFADVNGKYLELRPPQDSTLEKEAIELDLVEGFSGVSLSYERKVRGKKYPRGMNHVSRNAAMARNIIKNPRRLKWVAFDEKVFLKLLARLTELNDYLQELLHGNQARELERTTQKTYREMVQVRNSVEELKYLVTAAMLLEDRGSSSSSLARRRNDRVLARLADFKSLNAATSAPEEQKPPGYDSIMSSTHLKYSQVPYDDDDPSLSGSERIRTEGRYRSSKGIHANVWIEWRKYKERFDSNLNKFVPLEENVQRVRELVALLQSSKPEEFCAAQCLGYFDDRDDSEDSQHEFRFGLVFEKPRELTPISLHDMITTNSEPPPSLTARVTLAHQISVCILYLHAVGWLHKAFRSDCVIFFSRYGDISEPIVTGYEYARVDRPGYTTTGSDVVEAWELYKHPDYQGSDSKPNYCKSFDIYSLGIVLLEIAYWRPIEAILDLNLESETVFADLKGIREKLLQPETRQLGDLRANLGDKFYSAVKSCIEGREAFGVEAGDDETSIETGAKLQEEFTNLVADALESISV